MKKQKRLSVVGLLMGDSNGNVYRTALKKKDIEVIHSFVLDYFLKEGRKIPVIDEIVGTVKTSQP